MSELEFEAPDDPRMLQDYRPIGIAGFISLFFSALSCLALVNINLIGLTMLAAVFALIISLRTELSRQRPIGSFAAYLALFLSTFTIVAVLYSQQLNRDFLFATAKEKADQWLALVQQGDSYRGYELTLDVNKRQPMETDLYEYYSGLAQDSDGGGAEKAVTFDFYKNIEPESSIRRAGDQCEFVFDSFMEPEFMRSKTYFYPVLYRVKWNDPKREDWLIKVGMQRVDGLPPFGRQWSANYATVLEPYMERKLPYFSKE